MRSILIAIARILCGDGKSGVDYCHLALSQQADFCFQGDPGVGTGICFALGPMESIVYNSQLFGTEYAAVCEGRSDVIFSRVTNTFFQSILG